METTLIFLGAGPPTAVAALLLAFAPWLGAHKRLVAVLSAAAAALTAFLALRYGGTAGAPIAVLMAITGTAALLLPAAAPAARAPHVELCSLVLLGSAGAVVLVTSSHLLALLVGLETLSLSAAVLTGLSRGTRAVEAAFKYFILASLSVAIAVFGTGLHVLGTGSLELGAVAAGDAGAEQLRAVGLLLVALGICFELAAVPLHVGPLGVYMTAMPGPAGFLMATAKLGAAIALLRVAGAAPPMVAQALLVVGLVSITWGTLAALAQRRLRGMLGYSAVAHGGFLALAVSCGAAGREATTMYAVIYAASVVLVFAALEVRTRAPDASAELPRSPLRRWVLALGLFSLAGMPPTPGLWAKLAVVRVVWQEHGALVGIATILAAVFGALYYLAPVPELLGRPRGRRLPECPVRCAAMALAGAALLVLLVLPGLAYRLAAAAF